MNRNVIFVCVLTTMLVSCAAGQNPNLNQPDAAGFWLGIWHGMIAPITLIISLFTDNVSIYEVNNNGGWYDVGFFLGLGGGGSAARRTTTGTSTSFKKK